ncbi:hypothetical protein SADUNF_Sadunf15G0110000 [Salix dunnii]|uniref:Uncharacterized protein n=1 Tax=Salix dunnii TaxID=1413687 RepID=A0A835MJM9_9ROSI|nr:hypothetical protein SADUNF_Sadunf15G0110000 [Salix dunnii]
MVDKDKTLHSMVCKLITNDSWFCPASSTPAPIAAANSGNPDTSRVTRGAVPIKWDLWTWGCWSWDIFIPWTYWLARWRQRIWSISSWASYNGSNSQGKSHVESIILQALYMLGIPNQLTNRHEPPYFKSMTMSPPGPHGQGSWDASEFREKLCHEIEAYTSSVKSGFPSDVSVSVTYMIVQTNKLVVKVWAKPLNKPAPVNLALHAYWNLGCCCARKRAGRKMEPWTHQPGVQFYTSSMPDNVKGKCGFVYAKHAGVCSKTQGFPDAVNHPHFPPQIVNPGEID